MPTDTDVIVAGGGIAGTVVAAALHQIGYRIVVVEPGQNDARRLAGEVFHPPGVSGLAEIGLLPALQCLPAAEIKGFLVSDAKPDGSPMRLSYAEVGAHTMSGLGIDHGLIRRHLLEAVDKLPNVTVLRGKRITGIDQSDPSGLTAAVANGVTSQKYRCRFLVAADGAQSRVARSVGIGIRHRCISTMFGYRLAAEHLSEPGYAQVILGARAPILLYPISGNEARILFDVSHTDGRLPRIEDCLSMASVLPPGLRREAEHAIAKQPRMSALARIANVECLVRDRVILVGDAAGVCHPLTASGMTRCIGDALLLRDTVAEQPDDLTQALQNYQRRRRWPQATRHTLAEALRDVFCGGSPEARILQRGIMAHCQSSPSGRAATIALLSTVDGRPAALLRKVITVAARGFCAHLSTPLPPDNHGGASTFRIVAALLATTVRYVTQIVQTGTPMRRLQPNWSSTVGPPERQRAANAPADRVATEAASGAGLPR